MMCFFILIDSFQLLYRVSKIDILYSEKDINKLKCYMEYE